MRCVEPGLTVRLCCVCHAMSLWAAAAREQPSCPAYIGTTYSQRHRIEGLGARARPVALVEALPVHKKSLQPDQTLELWRALQRRSGRHGDVPTTSSSSSARGSAGRGALLLCARSAHCLPC
eukprot:5521825-Prymnesium_polylepis.1